MSDHVFTGHYASTYQEGRDATDRHLGEVEPFEIRDLDPDRLPDHQWRAATDEDRDRWAKILADREATARRAAAKARGEDVGDDPGGESTGQEPGGEEGGIESDPDPADVPDSGAGEDEPEPHDETPPGPQPAAPAVIPQ